MKRVLEFSSIFIILDQIFRFYAQNNLTDTVIGNNNLGLTYKVNYGTWVYQEAPSVFIFVLQIICIIILIILYFLYQYFCECIRKSLLIDLAYASLIASILGNVYIDRILFGYVRDYIINPIAVSNLADLLIPFAVILIFLEAFLYKKSRNLYLSPLSYFNKAA